MSDKRQVTNCETPELTICVEDWQIQCCGTTFKVGDRVKWIVHEYGKLSEVTGKVMGYYYEHHSSDWEKLFKAEGVVAEIKALFCSYKERPNPYENKKGTLHYRVFEKAVDVELAYGSDKGWPEGIDELEFGEYEVTLRDFNVRPAKKSEVTFS
jgi:hypothetical protein